MPDVPTPGSAALALITSVVHEERDLIAAAWEAAGEVEPVALVAALTYIAAEMVDLIAQQSGFSVEIVLADVLPAAVEHVDRLHRERGDEP
jgi:hypothetical protein